MRTNRTYPADDQGVPRGCHRRRNPLQIHVEKEITSQTYQEAAR